MSKFFSSDLSRLTPYTPGEQPKDTQYIKLNTNESPYPPSAATVQMAAQAAQRLELYPDPTCSELVRRLADQLCVGEDEVILGNGSDEILFLAFAAFCSQSRGAVFPNITYGFYPVFAELCKVGYEELPLRDDFTVNPADYFGVGKTVFIANPNAPTGIVLPLEDIERILAANPDHVVVVDEAYVDFGGESAVPLIHRYDNLLVVQTFSKSRSMAGARLGMGMGSPGLIRDLNTVKYSLNPYNINRMTLAAGLGALADQAYYSDCCRKIIQTRRYTQARLAALGFVFPESSTNFVFAKHPAVPGAAMYTQLKQRGILVRHFDAPLVRDYNRITIGTPEQMDALLDAVTQIVKEAP